MNAISRKIPILIRKCKCKMLPNGWISIVAFCCLPLVMADDLLIVWRAGGIFSILMCIADAVSVILVALRPDIGVWVVSFLWAVSELASSPTGWMTTLIALFSVAVSSFGSSRRGIVVAFTIWVAKIAGRMLYQPSFFENGEVISFTTFIILMFLSGIFVRRKQITDAAIEQLNRQQQFNIIARNLHDYVTNDLVDALMSLNQVKGTVMSDSGQAQMQNAVRSIDDALLQARRIIRILEESPQSNERQSMISGEDERVSSLKDIYEFCIAERKHLNNVGIQGTVLFPKDMNIAIHRDDALYIDDFFRELFGNIRKYADPTIPYSVSVGIDDRQENWRVLLIDVADLPKRDSQIYEDHKPGMHSGMNRYRNVVSERGGAFSIEHEDGLWLLSVKFPLQ